VLRQNLVTRNIKNEIEYSCTLCIDESLNVGEKRFHKEETEWKV
jgi:hypothetical protein